LLKKAVGENSNPFFQVEKVSDPVLSEKAKITPIVLQQTFVYDLPTQRGQLINLLHYESPFTRALLKEKSYHPLKWHPAFSLLKSDPCTGWQISNY
jgi:hypothetical protein